MCHCACPPYWRETRFASGRSNPIRIATSQIMSFSSLTKSDNQEADNSALLECAKKAFEDVLGESAKKIDPLFLKNRTLTVTCANTEIATELRFSMDEIVAKINEKMGKQEVDRIRYLL